MSTNVNKDKWSKRYQVALCRHLEHGKGLSPRLVQSLGRQAVVLGLETLDMAKAHSKALSVLISPKASTGDRAKTVQRARKFFAEASVQLEKTHHAAQDAEALTKELNRTLVRRTRQSATSSIRLKQTILKRQRAEKELKISGERYTKLLVESHHLLKQLKKLTHACLSSQETKRKNVSRQLQGEITQGLSSIHVRLLMLKKTMRSSAKSLNKEIDSTRRLVKESNLKVKRFNYEKSAQNIA